MARKKLGEILTEAGILDQGKLEMALREQQRWGGPLGRVLIDLGLVSEETLVAALSRQLNFPSVELDGHDVPKRVLNLLPADFCEQNSLVPLRVEGKFLDVAMTDPTNPGVIDEIRIRTRLNVRPYLVGPKSVERAMSRFYGRGSPVFGMQAVAIGLSTNEIEIETSSPIGGAAKMPDEAREAQREAEIHALQSRLSRLEALVERDEGVIRKLLGLLIEKKVATREEILERIK
jgi:type IV pilus assembly protein PilB